MVIWPRDAGGIALWRWLSATIPSAGAGRQRESAGRATGGQSALAEFEAFFWRFERQVLGYLWRLTGDEQTALDLSQDVFLRAWEHFAEFDERRDSGTWLFRVASNLAFTHLRRKRAPVGAAQPLDDSLATSDHSGRLIERDHVRQTLGALPPQQRSALVLHEVYGLSCEEIGQVLDISRDAVKMALWRGREQFRRRYTQEEE
jgi:RNA polymerase sigma-70 factor (ECF subfamily)